LNPSAIRSRATGTPAPQPRSSTCSACWQEIGELVQLACAHRRVTRTAEGSCRRSGRIQSRLVCDVAAVQSPVLAFSAVSISYAFSTDRQMVVFIPNHMIHHRGGVGWVEQREPIAAQRRRWVSLRGWARTIRKPNHLIFPGEGRGPSFLPLKPVIAGKALESLCEVRGGRSMDPGFRRDSESGSCQFSISVWILARPLSSTHPTGILQDERGESSECI
jgi:hypothetical protein